LKIEADSMRRLLPILFFATISSYAQTDNVGSGRALSFNGVNQYIDLGNIYDDLNLPITVSAWIKLDGTTGPLPILVTQDNNDLYNGLWFMVSTTTLWIEIGDGQGTNLPDFRRGKAAAVNFQPGQWYHVCAVMRNPSDTDLYVNGINVGGNISGDSGLPMDSNFPGDVAKIGYFFQNGTIYRFKGLMDDLRVYNIALTPTQVRTTMCKKLMGTETGLIGNWDFNETSGNTVIDKSTNGFNGTLINSPTRIYSGAPIGDESVFLYPASWSGAQLTMTESGESVTVSNVTPGSHGVQAYVVRNTPSQSIGLDIAISTPPYFGIFVAGIAANQNFDVNYSIGNCIKAREDNSIASWVDQTLTGLTKRIEFIRNPSSPTFTVDLGPDETLCPITGKVLEPFANPSGYSFNWQDGSTGSSFTPTTYGTYWVAVTKGCQADIDSVTFTQAQFELNIDLGEDFSVCPLPEITLSPLPNATGYTFKWQDGSTSANHVVSGYGKYWVSINDECSTGSDTIRIERKSFEDLFIPNIITPNGDDHNQNFILGNRESGEQLQGAALEVFNRWGKKVYSTTNYDNKWSADGLANGIYYFLIRSECIPDKKGWLTVKR